MPLELVGFKKAIESFSRALNISSIKEKESSTSADELELIRAGVIQNFEFVYELSWKYMKRWIEMNIGNEIVDGVPRIELFRLAAENHLINSVDTWMLFHKARNQSSHIYDNEISLSVYESSKKLLPEVLDFYQRLEKKNV